MTRIETRLRVMSWNLWWQFGPWEKRLPAIAATLAAVDADALGALRDRLGDPVLAWMVQLVGDGLYLRTLIGTPLPEGLSVDDLLARLRPHLVGGRLLVVASEHRAQRQNRIAARRRLVTLLREAAAPEPPARRATRPTLGSRRRRLEDKKRRGQVKAGRRSTGDA